ncbi:MAG: aromatic amino acid lyase [Solirubrobacterales bacterium]|nr:aromatic amino acid lyase [Solirubrobacterales bacterium]
MFDGERRRASEVLAELRLEPFLLEAKEGLALTNGTSFMSAFACLAIGAARELADLADLMTAMAAEALSATAATSTRSCSTRPSPTPGWSRAPGISASCSPIRAWRRIPTSSSRGT